MKPVVILRKIKLQNIYRIGLSFNTSILNKRAKLIGARWTPVYRCWHVAYNRDSYHLLKKTFADCTLEVQRPADTVIKKTMPVNLQGGATKNTAPVSGNNLAALQRFTDLLIAKGYSAATRRTYKNEFTAFLRQLRGVDVQDMSPARLSNYFYYCRHQLMLSPNTLLSRLNALKFYYEQVLGRKNSMNDLAVFANPALSKLPEKEKVLKRLMGLSNCKHRALLILACVAGLKAVEITRLKISDVQSQRMQLFIPGLESRTGRWETLSEPVLTLLRTYFLAYRPQHWLFEGQTPGSCYSIRSVQELFKQACKLTGLPKSVGFCDLNRSAQIQAKEPAVRGGLPTSQNGIKLNGGIKNTVAAVESPLDIIARKSNL